ncbi:MAG: PSD1 and planctomycete cytochrome C domain-containing protein [Planctomycetota bacterium]
MGWLPKLNALLFFAACCQPLAADQTDGIAVSFNEDIRPILADRCYACHGPGEQQSELRLDNFESATEWAIVPHDAESSEVLARVLSDEPGYRMPPEEANKPSLSPEEVDTLRRWIDEGAEYQPHWSYRPVTRPEPPTVENKGWPLNPIDRFLLARLEAEGVEPSPRADKATLVRRLYLDLTGLPPTQPQIDTFLQDYSGDAYERLVDELLASPRHAERMATWWFDLVRFATTVGYHGDQDQAVAPYRDYVLKAFHENMPFDQFTVEQLAGDLLTPTGDRSVDLWRLVATCYNRILQSSHEGGIQDGEYRAKMLADRVRNVSEAWLGSSMGCAECHDHKFDPITQADFYRMGAFFADVDQHGSFEAIGKNTLPTRRPPEILAWTLPLYEKMQKIQRSIAEVEKDLVGTLPSNYQQRHTDFIQLKKRLIDMERKFQPVMVTRAVEPQTIRVLPRGNWMDNSGEEVQPAVPAFFASSQSPSDARLTRLDLAHWITSPENPLTSRVTTNRLWRLYFGAGLSKEMLDVGAQGESPSHPQLLDWLAAEFIESGWDVRHMVRLMVTSRAYRQASLPHPELEESDPENRLLARQNRYRLEAEQVRDGALQAAGLLTHQLGGGFAKPYQPTGYYGQLNFPERTYGHSVGSQQYRRGVYTHWQRQFLHPWLLAFDAPTREECTAGRTISNTPSAALVLLNDPTYAEAARVFAARILQESPVNDDGRLRWAWREATGRPPTTPEVQQLAALLAEHRGHFSSDPEAAAKLVAIGQAPAAAGIAADELAAWTSVARVVLNLSETITRN